MPLLALKNRMETPPGYWKYPRNVDAPLTSDPKDWIIGGDFQDLIAKVNSFRISNGYPLGNPEAEIQDFICRTTGAQCVPANPAKPMPGRKARGGDVARFLGAMASWMVSSAYVDQEEAERRAEICAGCAFNVPIDDSNCLGCFGLTARVMKVIGDRHTRMDGSLQFCGVCGCSNAVQAFVPMEVLAKAHKLEEFPTDVGDGKTACWKREYADRQKV